MSVTTGVRHFGSPSILTIQSWLDLNSPVQRYLELYHIADSNASSRTLVGQAEKFWRIRQTRPLSKNSILDAAFA